MTIEFMAWFGGLCVVVLVVLAVGVIYSLDRVREQLAAINYTLECLRIDIRQH